MLTLQEAIRLYDIPRNSEAFYVLEKKHRKDSADPFNKSYGGQPLMKILDLIDTDKSKVVGVRVITSFGGHYLATEFKVNRLYYNYNKSTQEVSHESPD